MSYCNENDPHAAAWLRNLSDAGLITPTIVDERSIADVPADAVRPYRRAHFFAGIGGWEYALRLAGWPADRPVWTGSCPCQPYSSAGKGGGDDDPRNLWPEFRRLIAECRPSTVFGEQVASKAGRLWFDGVHADLEALGYAVGAADLCAAGVGAPHIRQRLYWVADAPVDRLHEQRRDAGSQVEAGEPGRDEPLDGGPDGGLGHPVVAGPQGRGARPGGEQRPGPDREPAGPASPWARYDVVPCRDGKARRVEPGTFPLAHGVPGRVGLLRGYGNAIVPQVAAEFVKAFMECRGITGEL